MRHSAMLAGLVLLAAALPAIAQPPLPAQARPELMTDPSASPTLNGRPTVLPDENAPGSSAARIVLSAEYTLLRPRRQASDFAISDPNTDAVPEGPVESLNGRMHSGFRLSAGYRREGSPWELSFAYTFFRACDMRTVNAPAGGLLYATQTRPGFVETADTATATSHWTHDLYDFEFGRYFTVDSALSLRVLGGVRIAHIGQDFDVVYDGRDASLTRVASGFDFVGAGLMVGGEAHWTIGRGFSLFGRGRGGMLFGATSSHLRESNADITINADITDRNSVAIPFLEMGLGLAWKRGNWNARVGYEATNWFQLVSTPDFVDDITKGHLTRRQSNFSLDGFFAQIGFSY
jgi:hypothetical protein